MMLSDKMLSVGLYLENFTRYLGGQTVELLEGLNLSGADGWCSGTQCCGSGRSEFPNPTDPNPSLYKILLLTILNIKFCSKIANETYHEFKSEHTVQCTWISMYSQKGY
jgi:hypothetical protein